MTAAILGRSWGTLASRSIIEAITTTSYAVTSSSFARSHGRAAASVSNWSSIVLIRSSAVTSPFTNS
jgi:hypothetical protein